MSGKKTTGKAASVPHSLKAPKNALCQVLQLVTPPSSSAFNIHEAMPETGFFPKYIEYIKATTDAPEIFSLGTSLALLAATVSSKVDLKFAVNNNEVTVPLHLWILLLGNSRTRKSSVCDRALRLYRGSMGPATGTLKELYTWLASNPSSLFYFPEATGLVRSNGNFGTFLSEMYDGTDYCRSITSGGSRTEIEIAFPRPTILTCASFGMLGSVMSEAAWVSGMFGRMLPFCGEQGNLAVFPNMRNPKNEPLVTRELDKISNAVEEGTSLGLTNSALTIYISWASALDVRLEACPEHVRAMLTRLPQHILRVAGLYALSTFHSEVDRDMIERAVVLGGHIEDTIFKLGEILSPDPIMRDIFTLRKVLSALPGHCASVRDIQRMLNMSWRKLEPAVYSMQETGELELLVDPACTRKWISLKQSGRDSSSSS